MFLSGGSTERLKVDTRARLLYTGSKLAGSTKCRRYTGDCLAVLERSWRLKCFAHISVDFLADGGFHGVMLSTLQRGALSSKLHPQMIHTTRRNLIWLQLSLSDILPQFPVPVIYAYDSSTGNVLGLEWILMERVTAAKSWTIRGNIWTTIARLALRRLWLLDDAAFQHHL